MSDYIINVQSSLSQALGNTGIYEGKSGAIRLAHEIGSCLRDSEEGVAQRYFDRSYNEVCVVGYGLNPPLDKKEWDEEVMRKWKNI